MKRIVAYARVSTREQSENQHALEQQIDRLKDIQRSEGTQDVTILFDIGSGADPERENFQQLLTLIETGQVSTVYATRGDRLTRDYATYLKFKELTIEHEVRVKLLDEGQVDWESAAGEFSADFRALMAQDERRRIRERVSRGFQYRRKRKAACARAPFGYRTINDQYVLDTRPIVCLISRRPHNYRELQHRVDAELPGISRANIAREAAEGILKSHHPRSVLRQLYEEYGVERKEGENAVLSGELLLWTLAGSVIDWCNNPVLRGHTAYLKTKPTRGTKRRKANPQENWEMHYNTHPDQRLLSEEEFQELQTIFHCNSKKVGDVENGCFYLTGLVYCADCGHKMVLKNCQQHRYYGCRNAGLGCKNRKNIRAEALDEATIGQLFERACTLHRIKASRHPVQTEDPAIAELRQQIQTLEEVLLIRPSQALQQTKYELERELAEHLNPDQTQAFIQATADHIMHHPQTRELAFWYTLSERERTVIYQMLVSRIVVSSAGQVVGVTLMA